MSAAAPSSAVLSPHNHPTLSTLSSLSQLPINEQHLRSQQLLQQASARRKKLVDQRTGHADQLTVPSTPGSPIIKSAPHKQTHKAQFFTPSLNPSADPHALGTNHPKLSSLSHEHIGGNLSKNGTNNPFFDEDGDEIIPPISQPMYTNNSSNFNSQLANLGERLTKCTQHQRSLLSTNLFPTLSVPKDTQQRDNTDSPPSTPQLGPTTSAVLSQTSHHDPTDFVVRTIVIHKNTPPELMAILDWAVELAKNRPAVNNAILPLCKTICDQIFAPKTSKSHSTQLPPKPWEERFYHDVDKYIDPTKLQQRLGKQSGTLFCDHTDQSTAPTNPSSMNSVSLSSFRAILQDDSDGRVLELTFNKEHLNGEGSPSSNWDTNKNGENDDDDLADFDDSQFSSTFDTVDGHSMNFSACASDSAQSCGVHFDGINRKPFPADIDNILDDFDKIHENHAMIPEKQLNKKGGKDHTIFTTTATPILIQPDTPIRVISNMTPITPTRCRPANSKPFSKHDRDDSSPRFSESEGDGDSGNSKPSRPTKHDSCDPKSISKIPSSLQNPSPKDIPTPDGVSFVNGNWVSVYHEDDPFDDISDFEDTKPADCDDVETTGLGDDLADALDALTDDEELPLGEKQPKTTTNCTKRPQSSAIDLSHADLDSLPDDEQVPAGVKTSSKQMPILYTTLPASVMTGGLNTITTIPPMATLTGTDADLPEDDLDWGDDDNTTAVTSNTKTPTVSATPPPTSTPTTLITPELTTPRPSLRPSASQNISSTTTHNISFNPDLPRTPSQVRDMFQRNIDAQFSPPSPVERRPPIKKPSVPKPTSLEDLKKTAFDLGDLDDMSEEDEPMSRPIVPRAKVVQQQDNPAKRELFEFLLPTHLLSALQLTEDINAVMLSPSMLPLPQPVRERSVSRVRDRSASFAPPFGSPRSSLPMGSPPATSTTSPFSQNFSSPQLKSQTTATNSGGSKLFSPHLLPPNNGPHSDTHAVFSTSGFTVLSNISPQHDTPALEDKLVEEGSAERFLLDLPTSTSGL